MQTFAESKARRLTRPLSLLLILFAILSLTSCTRLSVDPNAGAETVYLQTLWHADDFKVEYLRKASEGPLSHDQNAWTLFWFVPVNQPDLGLWLRGAIPEGAEAANVRANIKTPWYGYPLFFCSLTLARVERVHFEAQPVKMTMIPPSERIPPPPKSAPISSPEASEVP